MTWTPHLTTAVIVPRDNRFLMVEECSGGLTVFNQPAGHVEPGESLFDAAIRETLEETGWRVRLRNFLGFYTYLSPLNGVTYFRFCFVGDACEQVTQNLDTGIIAAHWLSLEELTARRDEMRSPLVLGCIHDFLAGPHYPLDLIRECHFPAQPGSQSPQDN